MNQNYKSSKPSSQKTNDDIPNVWDVLKERKRRGLWDGEIEVIELKSPQSLNKGRHYYVIENNRERSVKCISCAIPHGTILEAHMLHRYEVKDGIIYLDGKPLNEVPIDTANKTNNI